MMRKILPALLASLALLAAPALLAAGPNCISNTITAYNQVAPGLGSGVLSPTAGSSVQLATQNGPGSANLYSSASPNVTAISVEVFTTPGQSAPFQGNLNFQTSQDEQTLTYGPVFLNATPNSLAPSGFSANRAGNWIATATGISGVRVVAVPTTANPTWSGSATVYMCASTDGAAAIQGFPFAPPIPSSIFSWNGLSGPVLLGPGPSNGPQGQALRVSVSNDQDVFPRYRCSAQFTPLVTAAQTLISVTGSANHTVHITRVFLTGHATAASNFEAQLQRTSALGSGGTAAKPTIAALDSRGGGGAATAVCTHYTTAQQTYGTAVGGPITMKEIVPDVLTTSTTAYTDTPMFPEGGQIGANIVLRGTSDFLEVQNIGPTNLGGSTIPEYAIEFYETSGD